MRQIPGILALWLLALTVQAGQAAVDSLRETLAATSSLEGEFEQQLYDAGGTLLESSAGTFILQRPGRFYWHTTEPFEQVLVSDQQTLWLYDPDLQQVTVREVNEDIRKTPAMLLADDAASLADNFNVQRIEGEGNKVRFELQPRGEDTPFTRLTLVFDGEQLTAVDLLDGLGQRTAFRFAATRRNRPVDEDRFRFEVPEGVDVLIE